MSETPNWWRAKLPDDTLVLWHEHPDPALIRVRFAAPIRLLKWLFGIFAFVYLLLAATGEAPPMRELPVWLILLPCLGYLFLWTERFFCRNNVYVVTRNAVMSLNKFDADISLVMDKYLHFNRDGHSISFPHHPTVVWKYLADPAATLAALKSAQRLHQ